MLLAGDEIGHAQNGNNNAYCQDNDISWINWKVDAEQESLLTFVRKVVQLFHEQPAFHRRRFFHGHAIQGEEAPEIAWLEPSGEEMSSENWTKADVRCLGVQLFGGNIDVDEHGEAIWGDHILLLFNADHGQTIAFKLPPPGNGDPWELVFDTARADTEGEPSPADAYPLQPCSMAVFRAKVPKPEEGILPNALTT
jgi:glycogen operon protein